MIDAILRGAVARIKDIAGPDQALGHAIARIDIYDGQINEATRASLMQMVPAVFVGFEMARPELERAFWRWDVSLALLVVTRNLASGNAAALGGPAGEAGGYLLAQLLSAAMTGERLGLEIDAITPGAIDTIVPGWLRDIKGSLVGVKLATAFRTPANPKIGHPDAWAEFLRVQSRLAMGDEFTPYTDLINTRDHNG